MSLNITSDEHTITIKVPAVVTIEQVYTVFNTIKEEAKKMGLDGTFLVNMVKKGNAYTGRGFVWFASPQVYYLVLGRNADGTHRIRRYQDPNWVAPESDPFASFGTGKSWADLMDEEEAQEAPWLEEKLPSLIPIPTIRLTSEQTEALEDKPEVVTPYIEAALAHDVETGLCHNVLRSSSLPAWMTESFLKNEFKRFSHSKSTMPVRMGKSKNDIKHEEYPLVKIVSHDSPRGSERIAYITFDSATRDASFAFHMMRHREYREKKEKKTYIVNYFYARSRN
jgi:hypothetical protein